MLDAVSAYERGQWEGWLDVALRSRSATTDETCAKDGGVYGMGYPLSLGTQVRTIFRQGFMS